MIFDMTRRKNAGGIIVPKTITENGIYLAADDDADGYSPVTVEVYGYKVHNDGAGHFYVNLNDRNRTLTMRLSVNGSVIIDWGDGTSPQTLSSTCEDSSYVAPVTHAYAAEGHYHIKVEVPEGSICRIPMGGPESGTAYSQIFAHNGQMGRDMASFLYFVELGNITLDAAKAFAYCAGLQGVVFSRNTTALAKEVFHFCFALTEVDLSGTAITEIGQQAFQACTGIGRIILPATVVTLGSNAFSTCLGLSEIHFRSTNPPTAPASNTFTSLPSDCVIYVPTGSLTAYTSAANYPSSSTYTYVEE